MPGLDFGGGNVMLNQRQIQNFQMQPLRAKPECVSSGPVKLPLPVTMVALAVMIASGKPYTITLRKNGIKYMYICA